MMFRIAWGILAAGLLGLSSIQAGEVINTNYHFESIRGDEPNYFALVNPQDDGAHDLDEPHTEFYISLKYPIFKRMWFDSYWYAPNRFIFVYNGMYDFYMLPTGKDHLYGSSPIISRKQNPGFALEWDTKQSGQWRLGYFHESNGQSIDNTNEYASVLAASSNSSTYVIGQVSRGWDYLTLRYEYDTQAVGNGINKHAPHRLRCNIDIRHYFDFQGGGAAQKEDGLFWTTPVEHAKISEYDGLRCMLEGYSELGDWAWRFRNTAVLARIEAKTGISDWKAMENIGYKATVALKPAIRISRILSEEPCNFWISCFYFNGYGREPASYHYKTEYLGLGLELR